MNKLTIVKRLESSNMSIFTPSHISTMFNKNIESTRVLLSRLAKEGILTRVKRGIYCLPSTNVLSVASNIYPPSYISLWTAFEYYGTTTQTPQIIDIINPDKSSRIKLSLEEGNFKFRFIKTKKSSIYGMKKIYLDGKTAFIAEKEKAIIDGLIFNEYLPLGEITEAIKDGVNLKTAIKYAKMSKKQVVMKRLGYLLNEEDYNCQPDDFHSLSKTYVLLDPSFSRKGIYDSKWHIIDNRRKK